MNTVGLALLAATATGTGVRFADRPHWPPLPAVRFDRLGVAHTDPGCPDITGELGGPRQDHTGTPVVDEVCGCFDAASPGVTGPGTGREVDRAGDVLDELRTADRGADQLRASVPHRAWAHLAAGRPEQAHRAGLTRHPADLADRILLAREGLRGLRRARADWTALPAQAQRAWRPLADDTEMRLRRDLALLRTVADDAALVRVAHATLGPAAGPPMTDRSWLFALEDRYRTLGADIETLWPGAVVHGTDRFAAAVPTSWALAWPWLMKPEVDVLTANPQAARDAHVTDTGRGQDPRTGPRILLVDAAALEVPPQVIADALRLWVPAPAAGEAARDAALALHLAAGALRR